MTIFVYVGDTAPSVVDTLREVKSNGTIGPVDLTGFDVRFQMRSLFGSALVIDSPAVVTNPAGGGVRYDWTLADTTTAISSLPGPYRAWWQLSLGTPPNETELGFPEFDVQFLDHAPRRSIGPCTDWCSPADVTGCFADVTPGACLTSAVKMASEMLYVMSGRQFPGWCQSIIRPCQNSGCFGGPLGQQFLDRGHIVWTGDGWRGYQDEPCACGSWLQKVTLPGTAQDVISVLIGGEVLDPSSYRLDPDGSLIRTDGGAWPICQNLAASGDQPGTFQVTYGHGYSPPEVGRRAAAQMAREFWLACNNQACRLPAGVVKIVRQGIEITKAASLFKDGATGLVMVDAFLTSFPQHPPTLVLSPDTYPTDRRTG